VKREKKSVLNAVPRLVSIDRPHTVLSVSSQNGEDRLSGVVYQLLSFFHAELIDYMNTLCVRLRKSHHDRFKRSSGVPRGCENHASSEYTIIRILDLCIRS